MTTVQDTEDDGWYLGTLNHSGERGLFPGNYVEFFPTSVGSPLGSKKAIPASFKLAPTGPRTAPSLGGTHFNISTGGGPGSSSTSSGSNLSSLANTKMKASDLRATLMQKSSSLAMTAREKTNETSVKAPPAPLATEPQNVSKGGVLNCYI